MSAELDLTSLLTDSTMRDAVLNDLSLHFLCEEHLTDPDTPCSKSESVIKIAGSTFNFSKGSAVIKGAVELNHIGCVNIFLQNPIISQNIGNDSDSFALLSTACERGYTNMVKLLMADRRISIRGPSTGSRVSALSIACAEGHVEIVELLLEEINKPNARPMYKLYRDYALKQAAPNKLIVDLLVESYKKSQTKIDMHTISDVQIPTLLILLRCSNIMQFLEFTPKSWELDSTDNEYDYFENMLIRFVIHGSYEGVDLLYSSKDPTISFSIRRKYNAGILQALVEAADKQHWDIVDRMLKDGVSPFNTRYFSPETGRYNKYSSNADDEYYVFKELLKRGCGPTVMLRLLDSDGCRHSKKKVIMLLMENHKIRKAIVDRYIGMQIRNGTYNDCVCNSDSSDSSDDSDGSD